MKCKTPRIIYANDVLKCYMMENEPLANVEVEFNELMNKRIKVKLVT